MGQDTRDTRYVQVQEVDTSEDGDRPNIERDPIFEIIKEVDTRYTIDARLLITGAVDHENTIQPAHWDLIRITWRCIYAEIQRVRLEGVALDLKRVYQRTIRLFYGRVVAYAEKWRLWVLRNWHR